MINIHTTVVTVRSYALDTGTTLNTNTNKG